MLARWMVIAPSYLSKTILFNWSCLIDLSELKDAEKDEVWEIEHLHIYFSVVRIWLEYIDSSLLLLVI